MNYKFIHENIVEESKDVIFESFESHDYEKLSTEQIEKKLSRFTKFIDSKDEQKVLSYLNQISRKYHIMQFCSNQLFRTQIIFQIFSLISPEASLSINFAALNTIYKIYKIDPSFSELFKNFFMDDIVFFIMSLIDQNKSQDVSLLTKLLNAYYSISQETADHFCSLFSIQSLCQMIHQGLIENASIEWISSVLSLLLHFSKNHLKENEVHEIFHFFNSTNLLNFPISLCMTIFRIIDLILTNSNEENLAMNCLLETNIPASFNDVLSFFIQRCNYFTDEKLIVHEIENSLCQISLNIYVSTNPHILVIPISLVISFLRSKNISLMQNSLSFLSIYMCECEDNFDECWSDFFSNLQQVLQFENYQIQVYSASILYTILLKKPDRSVLSQLILQNYFAVIFQLFNVDDIHIKTQMLELMTIFLDYTLACPNEGEVRYLKMNIIDEEIDTKLKDVYFTENSIMDKDENSMDKDENSMRFLASLGSAIDSIEKFLHNNENVIHEDFDQEQPQIIAFGTSVEEQGSFDIFDADIDVIDQIFFESKPTTLL